VIDRLNAALDTRYAIELQLGQGGMATVYLAKDLKHNRNVALKVLKPELAAVVGAERFLAEIETTANLQHPHILPLFDSGEADGFLFYVMPYVDGETLRERIDREKQLPVDEAIRIATAVANALHTAHEQGIVHRDIKPANVLLSRGEPLIADFGIALAVGAAGGSRLTETGLSLGTPYYMSPEQATGDQMVGPASDIYALAAMLYEMLTGDPPYVGSTAQAVLGKIIQGDPVSPTTVRRSIPANVDAALRKALEKLPADRFTDAQGFARALADPGFRHGHEGEGGADAGPRATYWKRLAITFGSAAAVLAAVAAWGLLRPAPLREPVRTLLELDPPPSVGAAVPNQIAISDDGSFLVYPAADLTEGLWVRRLRDLESTVIRGTEMGYSPAISPDGREVAFILLSDGSLRATPVTGGASRVLADSAGCCVHWGGDGFVYFTSMMFDIRRVHASGGTAEVLVDDSLQFEVFPVLTEDGEAVLFGHADPSFGDFSVSAMRLATGEVKTVAPGVTFARQLPSGQLAGMDAQGNLMVAPFDAGSLELTGQLVTVVEGLQATPAQHVAFSPSGALVYVMGGSGPARYQPVWIDRSGRLEPIDPNWVVNPLNPGNNPGFSISPDGSKVAIGVSSDPADGGDIYVKQLPAGPFSRLTSTAGEEARPRWTPDGSAVTYISAPEGAVGTYRLAVRRADGIGAPEILAQAPRSILEGVLTTDGLRVLRLGNAVADPDVDIGAMAPGEDTVSIAVVSEFMETAIALSPDGRWLAHESDETGQKEVYVRSFPDPTLRREQISAAGGMQPVWGRSGRELFFISGDREMVAVDVTLGEDFVVGERRTLFPVPEEIFLNEQDFYALYDVDVDDQRFMMLRAVDEATAGRVVLVLNWLDELKERLGN
jgi:serine/threonine-protein kinase